MRAHLKALLIGACLTVVSGSAFAASPSFIGGGKFAVCVDPTFPPMEFVEQAGTAPVGVDIDVINALAALWSVTPEIVALDFNGLLPGLEAKRCDAVISGALLKPERLEKFDGVPYLKTGVVMIGKGDDTTVYNSFEDFSGKTVAVQSGTNYVDKLTEVNTTLKAAGKPEITLQLYPKQTDAIQQVLIGRVVAAISQDTEFVYREVQAPGTLKVVYAAPTEDQYAAYFRKDEGDLAAMREAVAKLIADGKIAEIAAKWKLPNAMVEGIAP